ncbi:MAG: pirin family protein [Acidithiobacillus sp.]|uniref:pirin family protein n=1 Tax=Acidithiobacillus sp. TaxID=1872118 RepID=UPI003D01EEB7
MVPKANSNGQQKMGRYLESVHPGRVTKDGAGVTLTRILESDLQRRLDPFLMLDLFGSDAPEDYLAGFPTHPHRGFETITYMLAGRMRHEDSAGHHGVIDSGGMQWMTAGRGILHSEMPEQERGRMAGLQLWLNLPARDKSTAPWYRDFRREELPRWRESELWEVVVLAGRYRDLHGPVARSVTDPYLLDLRWQAAAEIFVDLPPTHTAFVVPYQGAVSVQGTVLPTAHLGILADDCAESGVLLQGEAGSGAVLVAGRPLREPIVQYGPFVLNTQEEIRETLRLYRSGAFPPAAI